MTTTVAAKPFSILSLLAALLLLTGCLPGMVATQPSPTSGPPAPAAPPAVTVVLLDTSGSVLETDIPAKAQNKLTALVETMPVNSRVVMRALNSNVTAQCDDLVISLPPQPNGPVEQQVREANRAAVPGRFQAYVTCSTGQAVGGTEFWGGLSETYDYYPHATSLYIYSDTCDNVTIRPGTCSPKRLRDKTFPKKVVAQLARDGLIPQADPGTTTEFIGVGRNTRLQASEVAALRKIAVLWGNRAGTTVTFTTK